MGRTQGSTFAIAMVLALAVGLDARAGEQVTQPSAGARGTWKLLGRTQANHTADHDAIVIAGPYDYFRALKFKVTNAPLVLQRMVVRFDDGGLPENIDVRSQIPKGGESRVIELKGGRRRLKAVDFWYETKGLPGGKADLTLFGQK